MSTITAYTENDELAGILYIADQFLIDTSLRGEERLTRNEFVIFLEYRAGLMLARWSELA